MFPAILDKQLFNFCVKHGLNISVQYQDQEIRAIQIVDDQATSYQMGLETTDDKRVVRAWDYRNRRTAHSTSLDNVPMALEDTFLDVLAWIKADSQTRTPV